DGLLDRVSVRENDGTCTLIWQRGTGNGTFDTSVRNFPLPTARWHDPRIDGEGCTFDGQVAYRDVRVKGGTQVVKGIVSYHFLDFTGDGLVDLLTDVWAPGTWPTYQPEEAPSGEVARIGPYEGQAKSHTIRPGETLWGISQRLLGDPDLYPE